MVAGKKTSLRLEHIGLKDLEKTARDILEIAGEQRCIFFYGEMGSGKTTIIKEICKILGSTDDFSSPTYSIINEYHSSQGKIFHFDFYRLENTGELAMLGVQELFDSGKYCLVEWPENAGALVGGHVDVRISLNDGVRDLEIQKIGG